MRRLAVACLFVAGSMVSNRALADLGGCDQAGIPAAAMKGLQKAAKREAVEALDLRTLFYCTYRESGLATVDSEPVPNSDGTEDLATLNCSGPMAAQRGWQCRVDRYRAIRVSPGAGQPEVRVEVGDLASRESTREYALRAFALLNEPGRVPACRGAAGSGQSTESLRAILARRYGPYRLVISREGFALVRVDVEVRFRSADPFNPRPRFQCWEEQTVEE
jgi:hypothetical protein